MPVPMVFATMVVLGLTISMVVAYFLNWGMALVVFVVFLGMTVGATVMVSRAYNRLPEKSEDY